jgi:hypothetical protein
MAPTKLALVFTLMTAVIASASIVPSFNSVTADMSNPGQYTWSYTVTTASDQRLDPGPIPGPVVPGGLGQLPTTASFVSIYDFHGFTGVYSLPPDWELVTYVNGSTPTDTIPTDGITANLTAYWTGAQKLGGAAYTFTFNSVGSIPGLVSFTSQGTRAQGLYTGTVIDQVGTTAGPSAVPEPSTYAMMALGLGITYAARRRRARG